MKVSVLPFSIAAAAALSLNACAAPQTQTAAPASTPGSEPASAQVTRTIIESPAALEMLKNNRGMTLQWISWDYLGPVSVADNDGVIRIAGSQQERGGPGKVSLAGDIVRIDADSFTFRGRVTIENTPDQGRMCVRDAAEFGDVEFAITQNRKYWRMREFEWCDRLTDYIDIYF